MSTTWQLIEAIAIVAAFLLVLVIVGIRGAARPLDTLDLAIRDLLRRGYHAGLLYIRFSWSGRALELRKYINSPEDYGIFLCFPKRRWTKPYFGKVESLCKELGVNYMIRDATFGRALVREYLLADFVRDVGAAGSAVRTILIDIMGIDADAKVLAYLKGASVKDELITSQDIGKLKISRPWHYKE
jgi:hypothetical protein